ncbi:MAG: hypothetical protein C0603_06890 [Denitrovibrio sp.]|nr:MAG: hypothetical protein C0603_06890 [Denitrovibrio sp.]
MISGVCLLDSLDVVLLRGFVILRELATVRISRCSPEYLYYLKAVDSYAWVQAQNDGEGAPQKKAIRRPPLYIKKLF